MNEKEIIKKLKKNEWVAYGGLSKEEKFLIANRKITIQFKDAQGIWYDSRSDIMLYESRIYRISPDYQSEEREPEVIEEDIEHQIKNINKRLGDIENNRGKMSKTDTKKIWESMRKTNKEVNSILDILKHYNLVESE